MEITTPPVHYGLPADWSDDDALYNAGSVDQYPEDMLQRHAPNSLADDYDMSDDEFNYNGPVP